MAALSPEGGRARLDMRWNSFQVHPCPAPVQPPGFHGGLGRRGDLSGTGRTVEARGFESRQTASS